MNEQKLKKRIPTRVWIIAVCALAAVLTVSALAVHFTGGKGDVAVVSIDGEVIREIELDRVSGEYSFTVEGADGGYNVVTVSPGSIRVTEADCPDRICVAHGALVDASSPIVCMPHKLMIRLISASDADAMSQ